MQKNKVGKKSKPIMTIRKYDFENIPPEFKECLQNQFAPSDISNKIVMGIQQESKKYLHKLKKQNKYLKNSKFLRNIN